MSSPSTIIFTPLSKLRNSLTTKSRTRLSSF